MLEVIILEGSILTVMKINQDRHDLAGAHLGMDLLTSLYQRSSPPEIPISYIETHVIYKTYNSGKTVTFGCKKRSFFTNMCRLPQ